MNLEARLKRQVFYGWFFVAQMVLFILGIALFLLGVGTTEQAKNNNDEPENATLMIVGICMCLMLTIFTIIAWVATIVNGVAISGMTNKNTTALVIFSILPLVFVLVIVAIMTKNKILSNKPSSKNPVMADTYETKKELIDNLYENDGITITEYKKKLSKLKEEFKI